MTSRACGRDPQLELYASEDVSFFLNEMPGLYFNLGIVPRDLPKPRQTTVRAERS